MARRPVVGGLHGDGLVVLCDDGTLWHGSTTHLKSEDARSEMAIALDTLAKVLREEGSDAAASELERYANSLRGGERGDQAAHQREAATESGPGNDANGETERLQSAVEAAEMLDHLTGHNAWMDLWLVPKLRISERGIRRWLADRVDPTA